MPVACPICEAGWEPDRERVEADSETGEEYRESTEWSEEGNYADLVVLTGKRVRSYEDLIEAFDVDLGVWHKTFFECGTYEGFAKNERKHLEFADGKITGEVDAGGLLIAPMYRTKARFVRKEPIPLHPVVQSIECPVTYAAPPPPSTAGIRRALIYADPHFGYERNLRTGKLKPFHDRRVLSIVEQVAVELQPDDVILLGDALDNATWTDKFVRSPAFYFTTQPAVLEAHRHGRRMREACPDARMVWMAGNHDVRIRHALEKHLIEACELRPADEMHLPPSLSPERLMALHQLGIEWVGEYPDGELWLGALCCEHGDTARKPPGATARAVAEERDFSAAFGHIHRLEMVARQVRSKRIVRTVKTLCPGCACWTDGRVPGASRDSGWQNGLAIIDYSETEWTPTLVEIRDGHAVFDGREWVGDEGIEALRADLPEWNW